VKSQSTLEATKFVNQASLYNTTVTHSTPSASVKVHGAVFIVVSVLLSNVGAQIVVG